MARYDRIAPLSAPSRENTFPGWPVLRDLEGIDRDAELARRARLRFLALRPVRRLLDRGIANVGRDSYLQQIETVREELGYLPARDVERARLARFLHQVEERDPTRVIAATIEMAESCAAAGQMHGAEEFGLTALGLAQAGNERRMQAAAFVVLAHIARMGGDAAHVSEYAAKAVTLADALADRATMVRAFAEEALAAALQGDASGTHRILEEARKRAQAAHDSQADALVRAAYCTCEIALGNAASGLDHGWVALKQLDDLRARALLLEQIGNAFATLGMHKAAERCYSMVAQRGVDSALRARARARQAAEAAANGNAQLYRDRRTALLNDSAEWSADPRVAVFVQLELGRGAVIAGDTDDAREHLRVAIAAARRHEMDDLLKSAEAVLSALEQNSANRLVAATGHGPGADVARRIADQLDLLPDLPVSTN